VWTTARASGRQLRNRAPLIFVECDLARTGFTGFSNTTLRFGSLTLAAECSNGTAFPNTCLDHIGFPLIDRSLARPHPASVSVARVIPVVPQTHAETIAWISEMRSTTTSGV
jgi:hypothetical protein